MSGNEIKAGRAVVEVSLRDRIGKGLANIERRLANTGRNIASLGGAVTAGFGGALAALAWPTKLAADMEITRAGFLTLTKSVGTTDKLLEQIKAAAASTPFEFPELAEAARSLIAFGSSADGVVKEMMTIGDVAAGIHAPIGEIAEIYGKARVNGRLFADDINQLTGRGIPIIQELAKQFGVTDTEVKKLVENGEVNFSHLEASFQSLTTGSGAFAGGMAAAAATVIGKWSTMKDAIAETVRPIGEALIPVIGTLLDRISALLAPVGEWIKVNQRIVPTLAAIAAGGVVAGGVISALGVGVIGLSSVVGVFGGIVTAVLSPILAVVGGISVTTAVLVGLGAAAGTVAVYIFNRMGLISEAIDHLQVFFSRLAATVTQTFGGISDALSAGRYVLAAQILWAGLEVAFLQGTDAVLKSLAYLWNHASELTGKFFMRMIESTYRVFKSMPRVIMSALKGGASLGELLFDAMSGGFDVGGMLDGPIANAKADLAALNKQAANFNRNLHPTGNNRQQPPIPQQMQRQMPQPQPQMRRQLQPVPQFDRPPLQPVPSPQIPSAGENYYAQVEKAISKADRERKKAGSRAPGRGAGAPQLAAAAGQAAQRVANQPGMQLNNNGQLGGALEKITEQISINTFAMRQQLAFLNDKLGAGLRV